jgi:hypothetical protein
MQQTHYSENNFPQLIIKFLALYTMQSFGTIQTAELSQSTLSSYFLKGLFKSVPPSTSIIYKRFFRSCFPVECRIPRREATHSFIGPNFCNALFSILTFQHKCTHLLGKMYKEIPSVQFILVISTSFS